MTSLTGRIEHDSWWQLDHRDVFVARGIIEFIPHNQFSNNQGQPGILTSSLREGDGPYKEETDRWMAWRGQSWTYYD